MTYDEENITWHVGGTCCCSLDELVCMEQNAGDADFVCGVEGHLTWDCLSANYVVMRKRIMLRR